MVAASTMWDTSHLCLKEKNNSSIMKSYPSGALAKSQCKRQIAQLIGLMFN